MLTTYGESRARVAGASQTGIAHEVLAIGCAIPVTNLRGKQHNGHRASSPAGGVRAPPAKAPQHATTPSPLVLQACSAPTLTLRHVPPGGVARPSALLPQHCSVPSVLRPHVCVEPALTLRQVPSGGIARPSENTPPQQAKVPSVFTPHEWLGPTVTVAGHTGPEESGAASPSGRSGPEDHSEGVAFLALPRSSTSLGGCGTEAPQADSHRPCGAKAAGESALGLTLRDPSVPTERVPRRTR